LLPGEYEAGASTAKNVLFDAAVYVLPGLESLSAGLKRFDASLNLRFPGLLRVCIGRTVEARQQFGGHFRAGFHVQSQRFCKYGRRILGHLAIVRTTGERHPVPVAVQLAASAR
jgi:hypothetical protein